MKNPWQIWLAFAIAMLVSVAAVAWLSLRALESDRAEFLARGRADLEENARLALWRIDSTVAGLIAEENVRPSFTYRAFYGAQEPLGKASVRSLVPSPLLTSESPWIKSYFQFDATGHFSSPRVPEGKSLSLAVPAYLSSEKVDGNCAVLDELRGLVNPEQLFALLPLQPQIADRSRLDNSALQQVQLDQGVSEQQQQFAQRARGVNEFQARSNYVSSNLKLIPVEKPSGLPVGRPATVMQPMWFANQLLLVRSITVGNDRLVQGCWLNWPVIQEQLLAGVRDLLPTASLQPANFSNIEEQARMMAALPVKLITGDLPALPPKGLSPVRLALVVTWSSLMLAAIAVAVLLQGVLSLSERRASFVSAVTHELRTPLTTFRMYAEMLAEGMVPDESTRQGYLETLRTEADRLMHLVENVLAYARLERSGPGTRVRPIVVQELLRTATERLGTRAGQAQFTLQISAAPEVLSSTALANPAAVEQILFNLVDNACKYANNSGNRSLELTATRAGGHIYLRLRDHGRGIADGDRKRLFRPFQKSAHEAANSAPGIGLGLALSRRLARDMDGELALDDHQPEGACFTLTLKTSQP